jgi:phenylacetic acid degradation operon negative regulatory protein
VQLTARSFVLDLLSTLRNGTMAVRGLVAAGERLGIAENSIRVALARLLAAGQVERDERGRYGLGAQAAAVREQVTSWRTIDERLVPAWDGSWVGVHRSAHAPRATAKGLRRRDRALRLLGFRKLEAGLELRPNNLRGGVSGARARLRALGLEPQAFVFQMNELDAATEVRARQLWDVAALRSGYQRSIAELADSEERLPRLSERDAMVESFLLGGRVIRQLVLDPLLPEPMVPRAERTALLAAMRRYDQLGRQCWSTFMRSVGAPHLQAPHDTRMAHGPERLHAAGAV